MYNDENGFCCEVGDVEAMSMGIIKILESRETLESMSKESFRIVKDGYSLENHLKLIEEVYESIGERK